MKRSQIVCCWLLISAFTCGLSGCATLLSERKYQVTVDNNGGPTYFSVQDKKNRVVESGVTPKQVTLKARSKAFLPARYKVTYASRDGVQRHDLKAGLDWWTAGNILIGGVPGFVVDAASGAMWKLQPQVTGQIPAESVVSNENQGAAVVAASANSGSSAPPGAATADYSSNVQQASYDRATEGHLKP